jgi:hypothetical protein
MSDEESALPTEPRLGLIPPTRVPPTAVGAETPEPDRDPAPTPRPLGRGLMRWLRKLEIAIFGARRTIGPGRGRTPTF